MTDYVKRFDMSSPHTRNMQTLVNQAQLLRKRAATDPTYVEFVAKNMERVAEDYAEAFQKMLEARQALQEIRDKTSSVLGIYG